MASLGLQKLSKRFGTSLAVDDLDLSVNEGELVALLGPSGCGKTTTLRMVAGFLPPSGGRVLFDNEDVTRLPAHRRSTGMVFQSYALFPHMTAAQNVGFGLEMRGLSGAERGVKVEEALKLVRLAHLAGRLPRELSGGQQQRVALARALVINPKLFLLDEPLSNLDAKLRLGADRDPRVAAAARPDDASGHARPGGGADHGRPSRGHGGRPGAADRHTTRAL